LFDVSGLILGNLGGCMTVKFSTVFLALSCTLLGGEELAIVHAVPQLVGPAKVQMATSSRPAYLNAIEIDKLSTTVIPSSPRVRSVIVDSGINTATLPIGFTVNTKLSKSFVNGGDPFKDLVGHGTVVASIATSINSRVELVSLQVLSPCKTGLGGCGTQDALMAALAEIAGWDDGVTTVVNMSLENFSPSEKILQLMQSTNALFVPIAGNSSVSPATYPGWYAHVLPNAICIGSAELSDGSKSPYSNLGDTVEMAAFGTLSPGWFPSAWSSGTSFAAPQVAGTASFFGNMSPSLIKKLLIIGGKYDPKIVGVFKNPATLSGDGALETLQRLRTIRFATSSLLLEVAPKQNITIPVTDLFWLKTFLGGDLPQFRLTDPYGNIKNVSGEINDAGLWFNASLPDGNYKVKLVVNGLALDDEIELAVSISRHPTRSQRW
jgi:hypothetical protein